MPPDTRRKSADDRNAGDVVPQRPVACFTWYFRAGNVRRAIWRLFWLLIVVFVALPLLLISVVVYKYSDSSRDVRRVVDDVVKTEKPIPRLALDVFMRLNTPHQRQGHVNQGIQRELYPDEDKQPRRQHLERHLREAVSGLVTPFRLTDEEQATLVWTRIYLGNDVYGLQAGALKYFGKKPEELSEEEMVRLWIITISPNRYAANPSSFDARYAWAMQVWRGERKAGSWMNSSPNLRKTGG